MSSHRSINAYSRSERKMLQDHCGIIAMFAPSDVTFFQTGLQGLKQLQTRGYDGAGFWTQSTNGQMYQHKGVGMITEVFTPAIEKEYAAVAAHIWLYQVRYGTNGGFHKENVQPLILQHTISGDYFGVIHNGQFAAEEQTEKITSDTVHFAQQLQQTSESTWDQRVLHLLQNKKGAWSLVIATPDGLYIGRDSYGFRPLAYGHLLDAATNTAMLIVASETSALAAMGVSDIFELLPGYIAKITTDGLEVLQKPQQKSMRSLCIFENIYIQGGTSKALLPRRSIDEIRQSPTVNHIRRRCGEVLAKEAPLTPKDVDIVVGVPGTGITGGQGFATALQLPYMQAIMDKPTPYIEQRTFMTAEIDRIYKKVLNHFAFDANALAGKRVVLVDDSIVRGNIAKGLISLLRTQYDVTAVHFRVLSPPIDKSCHLGVNTRSSKELIAATCMGDIAKICEQIDADSLAYLSPSGLRFAITGDPKSPGFCMGCMVGNQYPIDRYGNPMNGIRRIKSRIRRDSVYIYPKLPAVLHNA